MESNIGRKSFRCKDKACIVWNLSCWHCHRYSLTYFSIYQFLHLNRSMIIVNTLEVLVPLFSQDKDLYLNFILDQVMKYKIFTIVQFMSFVFFCFQSTFIMLLLCLWCCKMNVLTRCIYYVVVSLILCGREEKPKLLGLWKAHFSNVTTTPGIILAWFMYVL